MARSPAEVVTVAPTWNIVEHRGRAGLVELEADWRRLYAAMPRRTGCHIYEAYLAHVDQFMGTPDELRCLALSDGQRVRAICPLVPRVDRILGPPLPAWQSPTLCHMGLADIICPEDDARQALAPALVAHLRRHHDGRRLLLLGPLPDDSVVWDGLRRLGKGRYRSNAPVGEHFLDCSKPFDELMSRLPTKFRGELRRRRRKLDALPDVRFVTAAGGADLAAEFETFLEVEASGWKGESGSRTAVRLRRGTLPFYRALLAVRGDEDYCEVNALYAEGRCIASQLCLRTGSEYACLKIGYDERYSALSPGLLLRQYMVERCCQDPGIRRMNWLSEAPWHLVWDPGTITMRYAYVAPGRWSGPPLMALLHLRLGPVRHFVRWARGEPEAPRAGRAGQPPARVPPGLAGFAAGLRRRLRSPHDRQRS